MAVSDQEIQRELKNLRSVAFLAVDLLLTCCSRSCADVTSLYPLQIIPSSVGDITRPRCDPSRPGPSAGVSTLFSIELCYTETALAGCELPPQSACLADEVWFPC